MISIIHYNRLNTHCNELYNKCFLFFNAFYFLMLFIHFR